MRNIDLNNPATVISTLTAMRDDDVFQPSSLLFSFSDPSGHELLTTMIDEGPPDPPQHERLEILNAFLGMLHSHGLLEGIGGVVLAYDRTGTGEIRGHDLAWHDALKAAAEPVDLNVHGVYAVTSDAVTRVVVPEPVE